MEGQGLGRSRAVAEQGQTEAGQKDRAGAWRGMAGREQGRAVQSRAGQDMGRARQDRGA